MRATDVGADAAVNPIRVAIVDDHEVLLDSLASWIQANAPDFRVVLTVASWQELVHSPEFPTDLVFLDVQLREPISIEARIRTCRAAGAQVVVLTGLDTQESRDRSLKAGAIEFLPKALPMREVLRRVRHSLGLATGGDLSDPMRPMPVPALPKPRLSRGEEDALKLYATGLSVQEVAAELGVQYETAKTFLRRVRQKYAKVGRTAGKRSELIMRAAEDGLLE